MKFITQGAWLFSVTVPLRYLLGPQQPAAWRQFSSELVRHLLLLLFAVTGGEFVDL